MSYDVQESAGCQEGNTDAGPINAQSDVNEAEELTERDEGGILSRWGATQPIPVLTVAAPANNASI